MTLTNIFHFCESCKQKYAASTSVRSFTVLTENDDVAGSQFEKDPGNHNVEQLRQWLKCRSLKQRGKLEELLGRVRNCIIFLSGEDKSAARVFNVNPRLNRSTQMNSLIFLGE